MALRPVDIGSCTDLRGRMPGALTSTRRRSVNWIGPLPSIGLPRRVDDAAEQALADRGVDDGAGPLDGVAFLDAAVGTEDHDADIVGFEVERHALDAARELDELTGLHVVEAIDAGDTVADAEHLADFGDFGFLAEILDLVLEDRRNFRGFDVHYPTSFMAIFIAVSLVLRELSIICEPTLTCRPPISEGSTCSVSVTVLPIFGLSVSARDLQLRAGQRRGRGDLGGDFAAPCGGQRLECLDDRRQREQPAVAGHDLDEIGDGRVEHWPCAQDRIDRVRLVVGADHRRAQEAAEIRALARQLLQLARGRIRRHRPRLRTWRDQTAPPRKAARSGSAPNSALPMPLHPCCWSRPNPGNTGTCRRC